MGNFQLTNIFGLWRKRQLSDIFSAFAAASFFPIIHIVRGQSLHPLVLYAMSFFGANILQVFNSRFFSSTKDAKSKTPLKISSYNKNSNRQFFKQQGKYIIHTHSLKSLSSASFIQTLSTYAVCDQGEDGHFCPLHVRWWSSFVACFWLDP